MTCIVGYLDKNKDIYIGADSCGTTGNDSFIRDDEKVFIKNNMIFSYSSSFRMGQLLRFKFNPPIQKNKTDFEYLCTDFIDELRKCFKDGGYNEKIYEKEWGGFFIIGFNGNLYEIQNDYQVSKLKDNYNSIGSGANIARGSLYTTKKNMKMSIKEKIKIAISAAEYHNNTVRSPIIIKKLNYKGNK